MSEHQRILYLFPYNPVGRQNGAQSRAYMLLQYFKSRGMKVDLVSRQGQWERITEEEMEMVRKSGLVENAWFWFRKPPKKNPLVYLFEYKLPNMLFNRKLNHVKGGLPNLVNLHLRREFDKLLTQNKYDYILISYAYYADLVKDNPLIGDAFTIIDTHDLMASQHQLDKNVNVGAALGDEIRRLSLYDQVWAISTEEHYLFSQFLGNKVKYVPMMLHEPVPASGSSGPQFDLIYVASDNDKNIMSATWFFEKVYPLLPQSYRLCVIGKINSHIPQGLGNVTYLPFVEDLNDYYQASKVVICPMLAGTGVKIKVVEAFAYGKPVVCNERGLDGLPDKIDNGCLVSEDPAGFADHIIRLLTDPALYAEQSALSAASFRRTFAAEKVFQRIDAALKVKK